MIRSNSRRASLAFVLVLISRTTLAGEAGDSGDPVYKAPAPEVSVPAGEPDAQADLPVYVPRGLGSPKKRTSGGVRGGPAVAVDLLAPSDHVGITTSAQPILYWHLTGSTTARVDFVLQDQSSTKPFVQRTLPTPAGPGFYSVKLQELGVSLPVDVDYRWSIALVTDDQRRSHDIVATAWIRRVEPPASLEEQLAQSDAARAVFIYADRGFWYDAIRSASRHQRDALLSQVGLGAIVNSGTAAGPSSVLSAQ